MLQMGCRYRTCLLWCPSDFLRLAHPKSGKGAAASMGERRRSVGCRTFTATNTEGDNSSSCCTWRMNRAGASHGPWTSGHRNKEEEEGKMSLAEGSGRIQDTEVPYKQKGLRGSCQVPAALGCNLALLRGGRARENISAAVSA